MLRTLVCLLLVCLLNGCGAVINAAQRGLSSRIEAGLLNNEDPATVAAGLPAYLLLVDGLIDGDRQNTALLCTGAQLYSAYAGNMIEPGERALRLSRKARAYGERGLCAHDARYCDLASRDFDGITALMAGADAGDLPALNCLGQAWATDVQVHAEDWEAVAEIPKVRALFERIVMLDDAYDRGSAHMYLGVLNTLLPEAYGGKPTAGRAHFERAMALSAGQNLMIPVLFAERYARLVFDRELHDQLLKQALEGEVVAHHLTLINTLAQQRARALAASADDYF